MRKINLSPKTRSGLGFLGMLVGLGAIAFPAVSQVPLEPASPTPIAPIPAPLPPKPINPATAAYLAGNQQYRQGNLAGAIAAYRQAIKLNPRLVEAYVGLGNALDDGRDSRGAIAAYTQALKLSPNDARIHYNLGVAQYRARNVPAAAKAFGQAALRQPTWMGAYINWGNALDDMLQYPAAEQAYSRAIALDPQNALAYYNLGLSYLRQRKTLEAASALQQAKILYTSAGNTQGIAQADQLLNQITPPGNPSENSPENNAPPIGQ